MQILFIHCRGNCLSLTCTKTIHKHVKHVFLNQISTKRTSGRSSEVQVVCSMENCDVSPSTLTGCAGALEVSSVEATWGMQQRGEIANLHSARGRSDTWKKLEVAERFRDMPNSAVQISYLQDILQEYFQFKVKSSESSRSVRCLYTFDCGREASLGEENHMRITWESHRGSSFWVWKVWTVWKVLILAFRYVLSPWRGFRLRIRCCLQNGLVKKWRLMKYLEILGSSNSELFFLWKFQIFVEVPMARAWLGLGFLFKVWTSSRCRPGETCLVRCRSPYVWETQHRNMSWPFQRFQNNVKKNVKHLVSTVKNNC